MPRAPPTPSARRAAEWDWASRSRAASPRSTAAPSPSGPARSREAVASRSRSRAPPSLLQLDVLVGTRVGEAGNRSQARLLQPRTDAVQEGQLPDRRVDRPLVDELLNAVQRRLTTFGIELHRLLLEQAVDVRIAAVHVRAAGRDECLEPRGRVAEGAARPLDDVPELLLAVAAEERRALERPEPRANADGVQVVLH